MGPVVVLGNGAKRGVRRAVEETLPTLQRDFGVVSVDLDGTLNLEGLDAQWVIVFGGDGAILNVSRRMGERPLPTLAVNFGRLGFLTEVEYKQLGDALERVRSGRVNLRDRMRLTASIGDWRCHALNDIVVSALVPGRLFRVSAKIERREAISYAGDGVVIATPTGSTAYSLAAGGPILDPELEATVITPLCAHTLSQRPLVIPAHNEIEVYCKRGDPAASLTIDGQLRRELHHPAVLRVGKAEQPFRLIRFGMRSYYSRLRRILGWGGGPRYLK